MNLLKIGRPPFFLGLITPYLPIRIRKLTGSEKTKAVFILSTGRTGTKFLADFFGKHPDITAYHEPKPSRILRMWSIARIEKKVSQKSIGQVLFLKRKKLVSKVSTPIYIESNPYLFGAADCLDEIFDEPIIINIVRDPRSYIKSSLNHGNTRGLKNFLNNHFPFWYPKTSQIIGSSEGKSLIIRNAEYWKIINQWLEKSCGNKANYHLFKFEDIFNKQDSSELERLANVIGVDSSFVRDSGIKAVNKSKDRVITSWENWTDEECRQVNEICQPLMKKYGYGNEKNWLKKISA